MLKNSEMELMLDQLQKHLGRSDIIGYAAARNARILGAELSEYARMRDSLVVKYGEPEIDDDGDPTGVVNLTVESENFPKFMDEIGRFAEIEHDPKLYRLPVDEAIGLLSGQEMLDIEWMFYGWDEQPGEDG